MSSEPTACVHTWRFCSDIPVRDFRQHGIATYECSDCGLIAESDPNTGYIKIKPSQIDLVNAVLAPPPVWHYDDEDCEDNE